MRSQKSATYNVRLKIAIVERGITQRVLASHTHIDETRLSRIVSGETIPTPSERRAIARKLRSSVRALFTPTPMQAGA